MPGTSIFKRIKEICSLLTVSLFLSATFAAQAEAADVVTTVKDENGWKLQVNGDDYYESVDLEDAYHPQTIVVHSLNGEPLPVLNGAPLRMRIERQLGYKHAKYLTSIEAVASLEGIGKGQGGYWEDRGYDWYGGI